jgi:hypothetical protein
MDSSARIILSVTFKMLILSISQMSSDITKVGVWRLNVLRPCLLEGSDCQ